MSNSLHIHLYVDDTLLYLSDGGWSYRFAVSILITNQNLTELNGCANMMMFSRYYHDHHLCITMLTFAN